MSNNHPSQNDQGEPLKENVFRQPERAASGGLPSCGDANAVANCLENRTCPPRLADLHRAYVSGLLADELMLKIDRHLMACRRCENHWDALTSALEDGMPTETCEDDQEDDCPRGDAVEVRG